MVYHTNKLYVIIIFFEFIHFGCYFTPLLYYSDKIIRPHFFYSYRHPFHPTQYFSCDYQVWFQLYFTGGNFFYPHSISVNRWSYRMFCTRPPFAKVSKLNNDPSCIVSVFSFTYFPILLLAKALVFYQQKQGFIFSISLV